MLSNSLMDSLDSSSKRVDSHSSNPPASETHPKKRTNKKGKSLSDLTETLMAHIKNSQGQPFSLSKAIQLLGVKRRRVYDITNVLQGVGYLEKTNRNHIKLMGKTKMTRQEEDAEVRNVIEKISALCEAEFQLDQEIQALRQQLIKQEDQTTNGYVNFAHLQVLAQARKVEAPNDSLVVIQTPLHSQVSLIENQGSFEVTVASSHNELGMLVVDSDDNLMYKYRINGSFIADINQPNYNQQIKQETQIKIENMSQLNESRQDSVSEGQFLQADPRFWKQAEMEIEFPLLFSDSPNQFQLDQMGQNDEE